MTNAGAEVTQHGGIGQIALPAGDGQLLCEVREHSVGYAEITLGILEINRVHLVRHG